MLTSIKTNLVGALKQKRLDLLEFRTVEQKLIIKWTVFQNVLVPDTV